MYIRKVKFRAPLTAFWLIFAFATSSKFNKNQSKIASETSSFSNTFLKAFFDRFLVNFGLQNRSQPQKFSQKITKFLKTNKKLSQDFPKFIDDNRKKRAETRLSCFQSASKTFSTPLGKHFGSIFVKFGLPLRSF